MSRKTVNEEQETIYKDLESKGFCVVPSFLSSEEVDKLVTDFNKTPPGLSVGQGYDFRQLDSDILDTFRNKVEGFSAKVSDRTNITVDFLFSGIYFPTMLTGPLAFHQDADDYFMFQNYYDYLNFYIPIIKPDKSKSNLTVVPFDILKKRSPDFYEKVLTIGATSYHLGQGKTWVLDESSGATLGVLDYNINDLAVTPELEAGDMLLLRGDVIHKTQDNEDNRVAVSFRLLNSQTMLSKEKLISGGKIKYDHMVWDYSLYDEFFRVFSMTKKNSISIGEFFEQKEQLPPGRRTKIGFAVSLQCQRLGLKIMDKWRIASG